MKHMTVLISGGSIAGPTAAFWLANYGVRVTLVEQAPAPRPGGNGVDVRGPAIEVIKRMGLWPQVRAKAIDTNGVKFVDRQGKHISHINMKDIQRKLKSEEVEILRGDLAAILYEATKDKVEYVFGASITALRQTGQGIEVELSNGTKQTFDVVIGADGIHSNVRRLVFGPESQFLAYKNHYFAFAAADPSLGEKGWVTLYNEPGRVAGLYRANNQPGAQTYFGFYHKEPLSYDYHNMEQQKQLLAKGMQGMGWIAPQLVATALRDPHFYFDSLSQVKLPAWSKGRVALVGDAAYCASPLTGAGAMLSLIGAYRLAGELMHAAGDYAAGFAAYEAGFRETIKRKQAELFTGVVVPRTARSLWTRNTLTKLPLIGAMSLIERRLQIRKNEQLPDYSQE